MRPCRILLLLSLPWAGAQGQGRDDGQWTMPGKNYASTRYSTLTAITAANVARLRPVWSFSTGVLGGHEGQPLVVDGTMYVVTPFPNVLYAFDLAQEGYPLKWKYRPDVSATSVGIACCDAINRGAFYTGGKIVYNLLDGHTVAVDAVTGKELWKTQIADMTRGETTPMAPFVVKDRVIVGPSGGEFGIHGWAKALDLATGRLIWTAYNAGPDSAVLAGAAFKPFYDKGPELALKTWEGDAWQTGGVPVWGWLSYDPELDLLYFGTGNAAPYNAEQRPGDNKWASSVLARRPEDGALVWAYQFTPHENWDYDANAEMILVDLTIQGRLRKTLVHFDKNGFAYTLDRVTGEVLVAEPFTTVTWAKRVDRASGRPVVDTTRLTGHLPEPRGREDSRGAGGVLASHGAVLRGDEQPVHGLRGECGGAYRRHALHRCQHAVPRGARRTHGRVHRLGRSRGPQGVGDPRAVPRVERQRGDGGRRGVLRHARWLVQGGGREERQGAVEVQGRIGRRGMSDHVSRA